MIWDGCRRSLKPTMNVSHTFRVGERLGHGRSEANAMNLLNQGTVISRVTQMNWNSNITREISYR